MTTEPISAADPTTPPRKRLTTKPLKQAVAAAMLEQGYSYRSISNTIGIAENTVANIKAQDLASTEHAERIKKGLRNRWAVLADKGLSGITDEKIAEASAKELAYIAAKATEMAGLAPPSIVESYHKSISAFLIQDNTTTGSGSVTTTETVNSGGS